jgi:Spy/CpxP family protein refolding chaperone
MTMITALLAAMVFSAVQDPPAQEGEEGGRRTRRVEFGGGVQQQDPERQAEQRAKWLKDQLGLSDEQAQKAADVYKQSREAEQKIETDRQAKLREILTDDQKKKYDEILANMNRPRTPLSGLEQMMDGWTDTLKKELSLDDAALAKIKPIIDDFRKKIQERTEKLRQEGFRDMNWQEEMQKFRDGVKESGDKVKEHLTPDQKEKFDKLSERFQQQGGRFGGERRGPPSPEERLNSVMEKLKITDADEQKVVRAAVQKVFEAQRSMFETERELRGKIDELRKDGALSDEQVNTKLNELRTARLEKDKAVKAAQSALREIISPRQELELIDQGALR